ncbi:MAG: (deoxy)nucleoside triphosphate pyrophosphohydrolase [Nocardioidaceae bacterium]
MTLIVAAAILREGRVLAARRTYPPELAGRWEFPGGKVDPGESPEHACVREVREELGCDITVGWQILEAPIPDVHRMRMYACALVDGTEPVATEHDALRWLAADELDDVPWLDGEAPFVAALRELLRVNASDRRSDRDARW